MFNLRTQNVYLLPRSFLFVPCISRLCWRNCIIRKGFLEDAQYEKLLESCLEIWFQTLVEMGATYGWRVTNFV